MHFWSVWHEGRDFEHYRDVRPRFCSEFGFQSYTSLPVIRSFADEADLNIASPVMESHQKNAGGNARIAETMFRYFRFPKDFANFVWLSQVQQGLAIKTAVDYWRSLKPHCMGALYWQLNDTWPVASWSTPRLRRQLEAAALHGAALLRPRSTSSAIPEAGAFRVTAVNDTAEPVTVDRRPPRRRHGRHHPPPRRSRRPRSAPTPPLTSPTLPARRPRRRRGPRPALDRLRRHRRRRRRPRRSAPRPSPSATRSSPLTTTIEGGRVIATRHRRGPRPLRHPRGRPPRPLLDQRRRRLPRLRRRDHLHPRPTATPPPSPSPPATSTRASPDP